MYDQYVIFEAFLVASTYRDGDATSTWSSHMPNILLRKHNLHWIFTIKLAEAYHYNPILDHDRIRLIEPQPSRSKDAMIHCELVYTRLRTGEQDIFECYTALSYVWGDGTQTTEIMVGQ